VNGIHGVCYPDGHISSGPVSFSDTNILDLSDCSFGAFLFVSTHFCIKMICCPIFKKTNHCGVGGGKIDSID
jgi:hypothetical protein